MRPRRRPRIARRAGSLQISEPATVDHAAIIASVSRYYAHRLEAHGPTPAGVDWSSEDSQRLRFAQLLKLLEADSRPSLIDFGCGYGALARFMIERGMDFEYTGFDSVPEMVVAARALISDRRCTFTSQEEDLTGADYTLASGIFNVKLDVDEDAWWRYIAATLDVLVDRSRKGFAFNMLTRFADPKLMRSDLHYADPMHYFALCKERYSRNVALLHDYGLYEFTVLVRLGARPKPLAAAADISTGHDAASATDKTT